MTTNPFRPSPLPVPLTGWNLRAPEIFQPRALAKHLERNQAWLQARPRTSDQVDDALFPSYGFCGMTSEEIRTHLNAALFQAGFTPSHTGSNPTWSWLEGE